jgi:hypothetical protein
MPHVGAAGPSATGNAPLTHRHPELDPHPGPQPIRLVSAWPGAMLNAGTVYAVPEGEMPDRAPVAALFRY